MPKTRRKQRKRKSRKKRGGDVNPFMFKSTHNANMEKINNLKKKIKMKKKKI